jgi:hypothetical protein
VLTSRVPRVCAYETHPSHIIYVAIEVHVAYRIRLEASEGARDRGRTSTVATSVRLTREETNIVVGKNGRSGVMDSWEASQTGLR